ncbi:hypothetical protein GLOIN_2v1630913 [Rhizophagus irregularis DAOM 181602=DAOM 197198]|nr:hypothetical protein GLOIN_2v1630913 [Rhizophagus irregularis DAOM 181602=DAOM 197198]
MILRSKEIYVDDKKFDFASSTTKLVEDIIRVDLRGTLSSDHQFQKFSGRKIDGRVQKSIFFLTNESERSNID